MWSPLKWLWGKVVELLEWILGHAHDAVLWAYQELCALAVAVVSWIPIPDGLESALGGSASFAPGVLFFLDVMEVPTGLALVLSAYAIRFFIRRIPVVG